MKKLILVVLLILLLPLVYAEPNYSISTTLNDSDISENEKLSFQILIVGGGKCDEAVLDIIAEGKVKLDFNASTYAEKDKEVLIEFNPNAMSTCFAPNGELTSYNIPIGSGTKSNNNRLYFSNPGKEFFRNSEILQTMKIRGALTPEQNSASGDYELKAIFSCLNNGQWYNFENSKDYHIKSYWEIFELPYYTITLVVSIIIALIGGIALGKAKEY